MAVTVYFANITKRRNSTLQGTFATSYDCVFKAPTSLDRPTFLVSAASMDYNAAKMGDRYYFIDDVVSVREGQWEVTCVLDVLATYKTEILASTQFVAYSANSSETWLLDTRIPVLKSESAIYNEITLPPYNAVGFYALTATGKTGTDIFIMSYPQIKGLISSINTWAFDSVDEILDGSWYGTTYDWSTNATAFESLAQILTQSSIIGNAYANAPQNIRSCMWLPLDSSYFANSGTTRLMLGNYDTGADLQTMKLYPQSDTLTIAIPWQFNDWRRSQESLVLVLPFAGIVNIPSDLIINETQLKIRYSISGSDGTIAYMVFAADSGAGTFIGTYGGSLAGSYAIGLNQQTSLGEIVQTAFAGTEKAINAEIHSSLSPQSSTAGIVGAGFAGVETAYNVANVAASTHPTTIGNFGGCAASNLTGGRIWLSSVAHDLATSPASVAATMGRPAMKPMSLSGLTGYCECVNAHVAAAAQAQELDAIDRYLNSGFFIE